MGKNSCQVVITGLGPISSIGIGRENLWRGIIRGKSNIHKEEFTISDLVNESYFVHKIEKFSLEEFNFNKHKLDELLLWKENNQIIDLNYIFAAIKLAIDDGQLTYDANQNNIGLVVFHENLGLGDFYSKVINLTHQFYSTHKSSLSEGEIFKFVYGNLKKCGYDLQTFASLFHIQRIFDFHGFSLFINNACCSGLYALEIASDLIKSKKCKCVVVAGSDHSDIYKYLWFKELKLYSPDGVIRPFSVESNGMVFGDGGAAVLIEEMNHAKKRKAQIYAEYLGGGFAAEAWKMSLPSIGRQDYSGVIQRAVERSGIKVSDIDLICPHGVGAKLYDEYEAKSITDVFGEDFDEPLISAFKPYVGHNLGSSSLLETIILLLSMQCQIIPATLNCENINPKLKIKLVRKKISREIKYAIKTCSAFAGFDGAVVLKKF